MLSSKLQQADRILEVQDVLICPHSWGSLAASWYATQGPRHTHTHTCALILFKTLAPYKSFTYLLTYTHTHTPCFANCINITAVRILRQEIENSVRVTCKLCAAFWWILCKFCPLFQVDFSTLKLPLALLHDSAPFVVFFVNWYVKILTNSSSSSWVTGTSTQVRQLYNNWSYWTHITWTLVTTRNCDPYDCSVNARNSLWHSLCICSPGERLLCKQVGGQNVWDAVLHFCTVQEEMEYFCRFPSL